MKNIKLILFVLFVLLLPSLYFLQYLSLSPVLNYGFTPDDWGLLLFYKTLGDNPLSKLPYVWSVKGAYTTGPIYFIGLLSELFNLSYQSYHLTNIVLKTIATLSVYPLILVIFKRKLLAFLTTILYGMSFMGSRSLEYVVKGTDYLAIIPMSTFFIIYYYIISGKLTRFYWYILMSFFWFISFTISPIRIYPILALIPLIEVYLWIQKRTIKDAINSFKRLSLLYLPFFLLFLYKPNSILAFLQNPPVIYKSILNGSWHLLLTPFQGLGLSVFFVENWSKIFGVVDLENINNFMQFLLGGPLFIFGTLAILISITGFKKPLTNLIFIILSSAIFSIVFFFIANHLFGKSEIEFDPNMIYAILVGGFMLAVSFAAFLEWRRIGKKDYLILALWINPPIILLYTFLIWLLSPLHTRFDGQQGYYLVIPAIASSIFLGAFLVTILDKAKNLKNISLRLIAVLIFLILSSLLLLTNYFNIRHYYLSTGIHGRYYLDQNKLYNQALAKAGEGINTTEPILFYFDVSEDTEKSSYFYEESLFHNLPFRILLRNNKLNDGCIGTFYRGIDNLSKLVTVRMGIKGFVYQGQCIKDGSGGNAGGVFYNINNFYAFKIKGREFIDIKQEILEKLEFK